MCLKCRSLRQHFFEIIQRRTCDHPVCHASGAGHPWHRGPDLLEAHAGKLDLGLQVIEVSCAEIDARWDTLGAASGVAGRKP